MHAYWPTRPQRGEPRSAPHTVRMDVNGNRPGFPRTFEHEDDLPRMPLPTVDESCENFLAWCAPLLTADELAVTRTAVEEALRPDSAGPGNSTPHWSATTQTTACKAGSTTFWPPVTWAAVTVSRSTRTSSSCSRIRTTTQLDRAAGSGRRRCSTASCCSTPNAFRRIVSTRHSHCRWSRTSSCSRRRAYPGLVQDTRPRAHTLTSGRVRPRRAISWCSSAETYSGWT